MQIRDLISRAHANAEAKGFHEDNERMVECLDKLESISPELADKIGVKRLKSVWLNTYKVSKLDLMKCELSEAAEAIRRGDYENLAEELADAVIRVGDFCGEFHIDLESAITAKMAKDEARPHKHGKLL